MKMLNALLLMGLLACVGCGTFANLADRDPTPYGGVKRDLAYLDDAPGRKVCGAGDAFLLGLYDLAATCALDTATLPYVAVRAAVVARTRTDLPADDHGYLRSGPAPAE